MKTLKEHLWNIKIFIEYFFYTSKEQIITTIKKPKWFDIFFGISLIIITLLKLDNMTKIILLALLLIILVLRKRFQTGEHIHWYRQQRGYQLEKNPIKAKEIITKEK